MKVKILIIIFLIISAAFLRGWGISEHSLAVDEAISSNAAISMNKTGTPYIYLGSENVYDRGIIHTKAIALSLRIFGKNEAAARLPFVISGILAVLGTFWLGYLLTKDTSLAFLAALALDFSVWAISWSHMARMYEMLRMWVVFALIFLYFLISVKDKKHKMIYGFLMTLFIILAYFTHRSGLLMFILIPLIFAYLYTDFFLKYLRKIILVSILFFEIFIFLIFFTKFPELLGLSSHDVSSLTKLYLTAVPWQHLLYFYPLLFFGFWFSGLNGNLNRKQKFLFWLTVLIIFIIDLLIYGGIPSYRNRYFQLALPLFLIFSVLGIKQFYIKYPYKRTLILLIILAIFSFKGFTVFPETTYQGTPEFKQAREALDVKEKDIIIGHPTATVYYYFGRVDYWLVDSNGEISKYSQDGIDYYAGAKVLKKVKKLKKIINQNNGYIILEVGRYNFIDRKVLDFLRNNLTLVPEASTDLIEVWQF